jgi:hypothetical protein
LVKSHLPKKEDSNVEEKKKRNRVRVGGLWEGNGVLSGNLGGLRIVAFKEKEKRGPKSPDYTLYFEEAEPKDKPKTPFAGTLPPPDEDNVPF